MKLGTCRFSNHNSGSETGMALLLCLLFLTMLTLLGLSASAETIMQDRLVTNLLETERARQSALSALKWAENLLMQLDGPVPPNCSRPCNGFFVHTPGSLPPHPEFENLSWWLEQGLEAGIDPLTGERLTTLTTNSINPPMWLVEGIHEIPPSGNGTTKLQTWYRILARGNGRTNAGASVVESIIVRTWTAGISTSGPTNSAPGPCPGSIPSGKCGRIAWRELL